MWPYAAMWPYAKPVPAPSHGPGSDISIGPFLALPKGVAEQGRRVQPALLRLM
jgi:hypothetical protein